MYVRLLVLLSVMTVGGVATNDCRGIKRDLIILLDSSSSVGEDNFNKAKEFLVDTISELDISDEGFKIGMCRFSDSLSLVSTLGQYNDKTGVVDMIRGISYNGGGTNTGRAVWGALNLLGRPSNRKDIPDQIITLTDGVSDNPTYTTSQIEIARAKNIEMISIGVGSGINREELLSLASNGSLMYVVDSYDDIDSIKSQLVASTCGVMTTTRATTTTTTTTTTTPSTTTTTTPSTTTTTTPSTTTTTTPSTTTTTTSPKTRTTTTAPKPSTTNLAEPSTAIIPSTSPNLSSTSSDVDASSDDTFPDIPASSGREADDRLYESMVSSAAGNWKKITGITVAAFALVALTTGLVYALVRRSKNKKKKRFVETL